MQRALSILCLLVAAGSASAAAELPLEQASYSADGVVQISEDRLNVKIYHDRGRERQEMFVDGLFQVNILRPDLDRAFVVQPQADSYVELPLEEARLLPIQALAAQSRVEVLGVEEEGGEPTTKYRLTSEEGAPRAVDLLLWVTDDGITMRAEGEMEFEGTMESVMLIKRNIERGPIAPRLFDPRSQEAGVPAESDLPPEYKNLGRSAP